MSTLEETLATRHCLSEYHVCHESHQNISITPFLNKKKEFGYNRRDESDQEDVEVGERRSDQSNSFFLHQPKLLFQNPPRVLRRGDDRHGDPVCLIYSAPWWDHWNVQFCDDLGDIIDPRGMVPYENRSREDNTTKGDDRALRGYKVRTWRVWGESGKAYHKQVNARRKMRQEEGQEEVPVFEPKFADEAMKLRWPSPMSNARKHEFEYAGIRFSWKGTRDLHVDDKSPRLLLPLNHLKLVAHVADGEEYVVALFTSAITREKYGRLWIFDNVITKLLGGPISLHHDTPGAIEEGIAPRTFESGVKSTRLYELVLATSMCMVIGEWEKRMTIYLMVLLLLVVGRDAIISS